MALRHGTDAHGLPPERIAASTGTGTPCRHCLRQVPVGAPYLVLAHRPFAGRNPYTETGPIFLCRYSHDERIVQGTGAVTPTDRIKAHRAELLARQDIAFVDIRSASNNCFLCRVRRG
ncbi:DUF1203 domain-containing protein [Paracoccus sp. p4-l81]|uniref:DUF1203 domain-containing protein n=1 Tax=Paracoccus sp. p4-l81 TaxID=3342806 RepID=UPI0035B8E89A